MLVIAKSLNIIGQCLACRMLAGGCIDYKRGVNNSRLSASLLQIAAWLVGEGHARGPTKRYN